MYLGDDSYSCGGAFLSTRSNFISAIKIKYLFFFSMVSDIAFLECLRKRQVINYA